MVTSGVQLTYQPTNNTAWRLGGGNSVPLKGEMKLPPCDKQLLSRVLIWQHSNEVRCTWKGDKD